MAKLHAVIQEKVQNMDMCTIVIDSVFSRILIQMIKIIFDSYVGPCLSPTKYGTTHDNYLNWSGNVREFFSRNKVATIY